MRRRPVRGAGPATPTPGAAAQRPLADEGVALPLVIGTMAVVSILLATALALAVGNLGPARADQDAKAANSQGGARLEQRSPLQAGA